MSDFRIGDEVVCVDDSHGLPGFAWYGRIKSGSVYVISGFITPPPEHPNRGNENVIILGAANICGVLGVEIGYRPSRFRKVQKRDMSAWLETATKFEEPKRKKVKA